MWVRIDDGFADHPKVIAVGPMGAWLFLAGLCYANRFLTDGFIPEGHIERLLSQVNGSKPRASLKTQNGSDSGKNHAVVTALCAAGMWKAAVVKGIKGYQVHDFLKYQPSRSQVLRERKKTKDRVTRWRKKETGEERIA